MPASIAILSPHGLTDAPYSAQSLEEAAALEPAGVYTLTRTFKGDQAVLLDAHLDRLEESARLEDIPLHLDRAKLRAALRAMIRRAGYEETRFRITVSAKQPDRITLALEPFHDQPERRARGVAVATVPILRRNPRAKHNEWMATRAAARARLHPEVYEGIIVNEQGELLEGFASNFYAVIDGGLYTANGTVLEGISRAIVLTISPGILKVHLRPIQRAELSHLAEAFLSGSTRGVLPIVRIDSRALRDGRPGPRTQEIIARYDAWVESHLEPI